MGAQIGQDLAGLSPIRTLQEFTPMYPSQTPLRSTLQRLLLVWSIVPCFAIAAEKKQTVDYVDPLIDSANSRWIFFSSACRPFGMVNLSPDTDTKGWWNSSYCYHTGSICGFNHVHAWQLSGPSVMPLTGPVEFAAGSDFCRSKFGHQSEIAQAGYHAVTLDDFGVRVELTSTDRVGMHRYTFPKSDQSGVLFNLGSGSGPSPIADGMARRVDDRRIEGYVTNGPTGRRPKPCTYYFVAEFDTAFQSFVGWADGRREKGSGTFCRNGPEGAAHQRSARQRYLTPFPAPCRPPIPQTTETAYRTQRRSSTCTASVGGR
jgi:putative alpha-1,2-mannosidase